MDLKDYMLLGGWGSTLIAVIGLAIAAILASDISEQCTAYYMDRTEESLISLHRNYTYIITGAGQGMTKPAPGFDWRSTDNSTNIFTTQ